MYIYIYIYIYIFCSEIFEGLIYNELFTFSTDNNLIAPSHLGFRPSDSCVNQLIAITKI